MSCAGASIPCASRTLQVLVMMKRFEHARLQRRVQAFRGDDSGAMLIFGLIAFVIILMVGGIAVDMMRYESERVRMQGTADRAVLAAAMMRDNPANPDPEDVVRSYFAAEGLARFVDSPENIQVRNIGGLREVLVAPRATMDTTFMRLSGVNQLEMNMASGASEAIQEIQFEIVLVLDVSGSMRFNNRIENLREAATQFVREMMPEDNSSGRVAITFVPYSTEVIMPPGTLDFFTNLAPPVSGNWHNAHCIDYYEWDTVVNSINTPMVRRNCDLGDYFTFGPDEEYVNLTDMPIRPYLPSRADAEEYINSLGPSWGTSIDLGIRAGAMFFDPTLRPIISHMIGNGDVSSTYADFPRDWNAPATYRAMILMTDGENCCYHANHPGTRKSGPEQHDADTVATCTALKAQNVNIYAVAFEAPPRGVDVMEACASSPGHFFNSSGAQLVAAFRNIATHIQTQSLRLTQ